MILLLLQLYTRACIKSRHLEKKTLLFVLLTNLNIYLVRLQTSFALVNCCDNLLTILNSKQGQR